MSDRSGRRRPRRGDDSDDERDSMEMKRNARGGSSFTIGDSIDEHARVHGDLKAEVRRLNENTEKLASLNLNQPDERSRKRVFGKLDELVSENNRIAKHVKGALDVIKAKNTELEKKSGSATNQARQNLFRQTATEFQKAMNEYRTVTADLKKKEVDDKKRQLRVATANAGEELTDRELDVIISAGKADDVMRKVMLEDTASLQDVVAELEDRHMEILNLERQVVEVAAIMKDLAYLVDVQQESIDVIADNVARAKDHTEQAEVELNKAEKYQIKARKRKCCLLFIVLAILAVIVVAIATPLALKNA